MKNNLLTHYLGIRHAYWFWSNLFPNTEVLTWIFIPTQVPEVFILPVLEVNESNVEIFSSCANTFSLGFIETLGLWGSEKSLIECRYK